MLRTLLVSIETARPHNMLAAALCVLAGYAVAGGSLYSPAVLAALATALVTGAGNVINDYFDIEIDRVNKPRRPLPSGRMGRTHARVLYALLTVAALGMSALWLPRAMVGICAAWTLALAIYAAAFKRVFVAGNVLVAAVTSSAFVAGALMAGDVAASLVPVAIAFVFVFSRELVKGGEDIEGDSAAGVGTFAVVLGTGRAVTIASVTMLALAVALPLPALLEHYNAAYFWTMEALVVPGLIGGTALIRRSPDKRTFNRVSWMLKMGMFFGIVAIGVARM